MGMTDSQFKSFLRFVIGDIKEALEEEDMEKKNKIIQEILENLQSGLED